MTAAQKKPPQDGATKPRPVDDDGNVLDSHSLPVSGPARLATLNGKPDPALADPVEAAPVVPAEGQ